jgi:cobalt-zinc-cadmium efflux system protein
MAGAAAGHSAPGDDGATVGRLGVALGLAASYMVVEVVGGLVANSLALLADAGHMLSDAGALGLALLASLIARRPPSPRRTWGYHRAEILAALANGAALLAIAAFIVVEALRRLGDPPQVRPGVMIPVAALGLVVNLVMLRVLSPSRHASLNVKGAWLHVLTDALGSVQAMVAGVLIAAYGWRWADPAASAAIAALVVYSGWGVLQEAVAVLMESAPGGVDVDEVRAAMLAVPGVRGVHDLHVWSISTSFVALSAHVEAAEGAHGAVLEGVRGVLASRFGIRHTTIQVESTAPPVPLRPIPPAEFRRQRRR